MYVLVKGWDGVIVSELFVLEEMVCCSFFLFFAVVGSVGIPFGKKDLFFFNFFEGVGACGPGTSSGGEKNGNLIGWGGGGGGGAVSCCWFFVSSSARVVSSSGSAGDVDVDGTGGGGGCGGVVSCWFVTSSSDSIGATDSPTVSSVFKHSLMIFGKSKSVKFRSGLLSSSLSSSV